jgi:hypothetical protein
VQDGKRGKVLRWDTVKYCRVEAGTEHAQQEKEQQWTAWGLCLSLSAGGRRRLFNSSRRCAIRCLRRWAAWLMRCIAPLVARIIILLVLLLHHCASLGRHWLPCACLAAALSLIGSLNQISRVRRIFTVARANTSSLNYCPRGCTKVMALEPTLPDTQRFAQPTRRRVRLISPLTPSHSLVRPPSQSIKLFLSLDWLYFFFQARRIFPLLRALFVPCYLSLLSPSQSIKLFHGFAFN